MMWSFDFFFVDKAAEKSHDARDLRCHDIYVMSLQWLQSHQSLQIDTEIVTGNINFNDFFDVRFLKTLLTIWSDVT